MKKVAILILLLILFVIIMFFPYLARAQTSSLPVPDIRGWHVVSSSRIDLRISDLAVIYIGFEVELSNPADENEHLRVIYRHIPLTVTRQKEPNQYLLNDVAYSYVNQEDERLYLIEASKKSDPITFVYWRTIKNPRNGNDMLDGNADLWLLLPNGRWAYSRNYPVIREFLSENIGSEESWNIFTGMKFRIDKEYHIIRADRILIEVLAKGEE